MLTLLSGKSREPAALVGIACFLLWLPWLAPATALRLGLLVLLGCSLALLLRDRWLKGLLLVMVALNLVMLGRDRIAGTAANLLTLVHLFVLA